MKNKEKTVFDIHYEKGENWSMPEYFIGIDPGSSDKDLACYCLLSKAGDVTTLLLSKGNTDKKEFQEEVDNLAKYFNAKVIEQKYGK